MIFWKGFAVGALSVMMVGSLIFEIMMCKAIGDWSGLERSLAFYALILAVLVLGGF